LVLDPANYWRRHFPAHFSRSGNNLSLKNPAGGSRHLLLATPSGNANQAKEGERNGKGERMDTLSILLSLVSLVSLRGAFRRYQALLLQVGPPCSAGGARAPGGGTDRAIGMDPRLTAYLAFGMAVAVTIVFLMTRYQ
jgi:hypothetical protein